MAARPKTNARERILIAAQDLFYRQGYHYTTVDQVIEQSGVSKPTVYSYFPTKEDLCVAYLQDRRVRETEMLKQRLRQVKTPKERFMAVAHYMKESMLSSDYRGCGFFNMIAEIPDVKNPIVKEARVYVDSVRETIRDGVIELKNSSPKYKRLDVDRATEAYYLIIGGAIMGGQEYREPWPIERALKEVERLIET